MSLIVKKIIIIFLIFFQSSLKTINSCYFEIKSDIKQHNQVKWQSYLDNDQKNRIEAVSQNIVRLDGIEKYKTNLIELNLMDNKITSIEKLIHLKNLKRRIRS